MKKGIVIGLAIAFMVLFVGCGDEGLNDKDENTNKFEDTVTIEQQLIGSTWYQSQSTETDLGPGYVNDGINSYVENVILKITSTVTYTFNADTFTCTTEVIQKKMGWISEDYCLEKEELLESITVTGTWNIENDRLYMIENNATQGTSFAVSIINDELILENEYAGIFLRLKRK